MYRRRQLGLAAIAPCDDALTAEFVAALRLEGVVFAGWPSDVVYMSRDTDRRDIARQGAAAWLRARVGLAPHRARYADEEAIAARVAAVLRCSADDVRLYWRSSELERIGEARGNRCPELDGADIAALIRAGFEPSSLGWEVPGDCCGAEPEQVTAEGAGAPVKGE